MINVEKLLKEMKRSSEDVAYNNYINKRYTEFILVSDLPTPYLNHNIDINKLPTKIKILNDNIFDIVNNKYNYIFNVAKYKDTCYISSMLLDTYFTSCIKNDHIVESMLYIDTNLILEDYKKLMDVQSGNEVKISLSHSIETISRNLENAAFVIWDKFSLVNSNYDKQKLYNILLTRSRRGLGNIFFIKNAPNILANVYDDEMYDLMDSEEIVDLSQQNIIYKTTSNPGGTKW